MTAIWITSIPTDAIATVSPETVAALDALTQTFSPDQPWQVDVAIGWTPADTIHLTARPRHHQETTS